MTAKRTEIKFLLVAILRRKSPKLIEGIRSRPRYLTFLVTVNVIKIFFSVMLPFLKLENETIRRVHPLKELIRRKEKSKKLSLVKELQSRLLLN